VTTDNEIEIARAGLRLSPVKVTFPDDDNLEETHVPPAHSDAAADGASGASPLDRSSADAT
jgi:hypothetical protein